MLLGPYDVITLVDGDEDIIWHMLRFFLFCFVYVFSLFLEVSHGTAALTHFSLTYRSNTIDS